MTSTVSEENWKLADEMLAALGFSDTQRDHRWNVMQREYDTPCGTIIVWGRDWSRMILQWSQNYEATVTVLETDDVQLLKHTTERLLEFVKSLPVLEEA